MTKHLRGGGLLAIPMGLVLGIVIIWLLAGVARLVDSFIVESQKTA